MVLAEEPLPGALVTTGDDHDEVLSLDRDIFKV
jgi:hypothetical protein